MTSSPRLLIVFLIFIVSGIISSQLPDLYIGVNLFTKMGVYPIAIIFGIAYLTAHIIVVNRKILKERLLKSTLFLIFGTQISYFIAVQSVIIYQTALPRDLRVFSYLFGNIVGALTLFIAWRVLVSLNKATPALLQTLLAGCVAFFITSIFGFQRDGDFGNNILPKSMEVFFISWQVLVGMTLLYVAKKYRKTETSNATTENQQISQTKMTIDSSISQS